MRRTLFLGALAALLAAVAAAPLKTHGAGTQLPPGSGADIVAVACSQCHGLDVIARQREGERAWRDEVYDMILRGAEVGPSEIHTVVTYLVTQFGPGVPVPGQPQAAVALPEGSGKQFVAGTCTTCHGLDRAVAGRRSKAEWEKTVAKMMYLGGRLSADQARMVTDYLATNFGR